MTIGHRIAAAIVAVVLPAYSWHDGSGWLAWRMFSKSETYRLTVRVTDAGGGDAATESTTRNVECS